MKVLLSRFHLNGHMLWFDTQTKASEDLTLGVKGLMHILLTNFSLALCLLACLTSVLFTPVRHWRVL